MGQLAGAIAVVVTVGYLAVQISIARLAASDANRLQRRAGVREMIFNVLNNEQLRRATDKSERYGETIRVVAQHLELSEDEASLALTQHLQQNPIDLRLTCARSARVER